MKKKISPLSILKDGKMSIKDMLTLKKGVKMLKELDKDNGKSFIDFLSETVEKYPNNDFLVYGKESLTYNEVDKLTNQLSRKFAANGMKEGDAVALLAKNSVEYMLTFIAGIKMGLVMSLINTSLRGESLRHCIEVTNCKFVILGDELIDVFKEEFAESMEGRIFYINKDNLNLESQEEKSGAPYLFNKVTDQLSSPIGFNSGLDAPIFYLFTSGSTGLPKAALFTNRRFVVGYAGYGLALGRLTPKDRLYVFLPFFHGNSMVVSLNIVLSSGAAFLIGEKFSRSKFWETVNENGATAFSYIGEICRYLLSNAPSEKEKTHSVKKVFGNGLKPELWDEFEDRFGIKKVGEFYGASESPIGFMNVFYLKHTVGFTTIPYEIVKFDFEKDEPYRNEKGLMEKVKKGDIGLLITPMSKNFAGYSDKKKNESLFIRNVFKKDDLWINTGDMVRDMGCNHIQFAERSGDSYRWKGENTSASEIEKLIDSVEGVEKTAVYGVPLDKYDGKAGMASLMIEDPSVIGNIYDYLKANTQEPSMPVFLRVVDNFETTETHKIKKINLKKMGAFEELEDVYIVDHAKKQYRKITESDVEKIKEGTQKV